MKLLLNTKNLFNSFKDVKNVLQQQSILARSWLSGSPFFSLSRYCLCENVTLVKHSFGRFSITEHGDGEEEVSFLIVWPSFRVVTADETFGATCLFRFDFLPEHLSSCLSIHGSQTSHPRAQISVSPDWMILTYKQKV